VHLFRFLEYKKYALLIDLYANFLVNLELTQSPKKRSHARLLGSASRKIQSQNVGHRELRRIAMGGVVQGQPDKIPAFTIIRAGPSGDGGLS
jgi:hypothetical protein